MEQLLTTERNIQSKIRDKEGNMGFWQEMDGQIKVFIARKRVRENHGRVLRLQLARIKEEQKKEIQSATQNRPVEAAPPVKRIKSEEDEEEDEDDEKLSKKVRRKIDVQSLDDPELDEQEKERKWRYETTENE